MAPLQGFLPLLHPGPTTERQGLARWSFATAQEGLFISLSFLGLFHWAVKGQSVCLHSKQLGQNDGLQM